MVSKPSAYGYLPSGGVSGGRSRARGGESFGDVVEVLHHPAGGDADEGVVGDEAEGQHRVSVDELRYPPHHQLAVDEHREDGEHGAPTVQQHVLKMKRVAVASSQGTTTLSHLSRPSKPALNKLASSVCVRSSLSPRGTQRLT